MDKHWKGTPISSGTAVGVLLFFDERMMAAGIVELPGDLTNGVVLAGDSIPPEVASVSTEVRALIMAEGGILSHGAILAREMGIPGVAGIALAGLVPEGSLLEVNGSEGTVHLVERPTPRGNEAE